MRKRPKKANVPLVFLTVLLGLGTGTLITYSSSTPSPVDSSSYPELAASDIMDIMQSNTVVITDETESKELVANAESQENALDPGASEIVSDTPDELAAGEAVAGEASSDSPETGEAPAAETAAGETPVPAPLAEAGQNAAAAAEYTASPEAARGIWKITADGLWYLMVDEQPYHGWFYDTDKHIYYFDPASDIMVTGWNDIGDKRYYFDEDGILQTGEIILEDGRYVLGADGSLQEFFPNPTPTPAPAASPDQSQNSTAASVNPAETSGSSVKPKPGSAGLVALTFDDGPGSYTMRLLDCLETYQVPATFFMVGTEVEAFPEAVKRMEALGCELGNHSYDHKELTKLDSSAIREEIEKVDELLTDLVGHGATVIRPPYGSINDKVREAVGRPMVLWSVDTLDWKTKDAYSALEEALVNVRDGSIILMHDIYETSVEAVEMLVPELLAQGYQFLTVHQLAEARGAEMKDGIAYGSFYTESEEEQPEDTGSEDTESEDAESEDAESEDTESEDTESEGRDSSD